MKTRFLFFLLILAFKAYGQEDHDTFSFLLNGNQIKYISFWRYQLGDHPKSELIDRVDSLWTKVHITNHKRENRGIHWYRTRIRFVGEQNNGKSLTLRIFGLPMAYEVLWDGHPIGPNGRIGRYKEEEVPGSIMQSYQLKEEMILPGEHVIAIRLSDHNGQPIFRRCWVALSYDTDWHSNISKILYRDFLWIGIYLTTMVLSLALYLGGRRHRSFLIFGAFCLVTTLYYSVLPLTMLCDIQMSNFDFIFGSRYINFLLAPILMNVFLVFNFDHHFKAYHIGIFIALAILFGCPTLPPEARTKGYSGIMIFYGVGLLLYAVKRKKPGSNIAFMGIIFVTIPIFLDFLRFFLRIEIGSIPGEYFVIPFIFCITLSISQRIREQDRLHETAKLRSHRLETEFLKKTIQPHFVMNTLLSIISLITEDPKKAVKLIKALADEFRMINRISSQKQIQIQEELDLCKKHLELMGYRLDANYTFHIQGTCDDETIPPMILHTLIENGLTHAFKAKESGHFWFECIRKKGQVQYRLRNDGSLLHHYSNQPDTLFEEGMGLKYVRARLEECYTSNWEMEYGLKKGQWEVTITVYT